MMDVNEKRGPAIEPREIKQEGESRAYRSPKRIIMSATSPRPAAQHPVRAMRE